MSLRDPAFIEDPVFIIRSFTATGYSVNNSQPTVPPTIQKVGGTKKIFLLASLADCTPHFQICGAALARSALHRATIALLWLIIIIITTSSTTRGKRIIITPNGSTARVVKFHLRTRQYIYTSIIRTDGSFIDGRRFDLDLDLSVVFVLVEPAMTGERVALALGRNVDLELVEKPPGTRRRTVVTDTDLLQLQ